MGTAQRDHDPDCGGCQGLGSHRRWCPAVVGYRAHRLGKQSEQAENLADSVGANHPGAANALYHAAGLLAAAARGEST